MTVVAIIGLTEVILRKQIFFEIHGANNNSSIWFLLPDNKVLLYIMDDATTLNFKGSDFNDFDPFRKSRSHIQIYCYT